MTKSKKPARQAKNQKAETIGEQELDAISGGPIYMKIDGVDGSVKGDGVVDSADYQVWRSNYGSTGG